MDNYAYASHYESQFAVDATKVGEVWTVVVWLSEGVDGNYW